MLVAVPADGVESLQKATPTRERLDVLTARDGYSGVRIIAEQRLETRLIALMGYGDPSDRERTRLAGFHAHLVKPASADAILACIAEYLDPQNPE